MSQFETESLHLHFLGSPGWRHGGAHGNLEFKHAALLALLAVRGRTPRDEVVRLVWPDDLAKGKVSLRQASFRLREDTKHQVLEIQGSTISLAAGVDVDIRHSVADWQAERLLGECGFMAGISLGTVAPRFEEWMVGQRQQWAERAAHALLSRAAEAEVISGADRAIELIDRALTLAPWLEATWCAKIRLHYLNGDQAAAARAYAQLCEQLHREGVQPSVATRELWRTVQRADVSVRSSSAVLQPSLLRPPALIGRSRELALIRGAWQDRRAVLLRGEAGIGKTHLLRHALREFGAAIVVRARFGEQRSPYATLRSMLRSLMDLQGLDRTSQPYRLVDRLLPESRRSDDNFPLEDFQVREAIERVLLDVAEAGCAAVAIDDMHFADRPSVEMLRWLSSGAASEVLRFAFATRPVDRAGDLAIPDDWLAGSDRPELVDLAPLTASDVQTLVESLDLDQMVAPVDAHSLHAHTGGLPFFVIETLKHAALAGPGCRIDRLITPRSVAAMLDHSITTVADAARPILHLMAVMDTSLEVTAKALQGPSTAVLAQLGKELERIGILRAGALSHDLMREAVLRSVPADELPALHSHAATALTPDPRVPRAVIASHWELAGRWLDAGIQFRAAGIEARDSGRLAEARELLERAADCYVRVDAADALFDTLFDALDGELYLFGPDAANKLLDRLDMLASSPEHRARVAIFKARAEIDFHAFNDRALELAGDALKLVTPFPHLQSAALAVYALGLTRAGQYNEALAAGKEALRLARGAGDTRRAREIASDLVYVNFESARLGEAIEGARLLFEELEASGDRSSAAVMAGNLSAALVNAGNPGGALASAMFSDARHREMDPSASGPLALISRGTLAWIHAYLGDYRSAIEALNGLQQSTTSRAPKFIRERLGLASGRIWVTLGRDELASAAIGDIDDAPSPVNRVRIAGLKAAIAQIRGEPDQPFLEEIGQAFAEVGEVSLMHIPWYEWSRQGDPHAVVVQLRQLVERFRLAGAPGMARTVHLRMVARLTEIGTAEATAEALTLARELRAELAQGTSVAVYLPEAWLILALALEHAEDERGALACRHEGRSWIDRAIPLVPEQWRDSFRERNPINAQFL